ncbi:Os01g0341100 [Oryza sativa Japonica Group]|uniref:Os01g0341100 protein n=2 Tax=Oryza sativa subsp. japonica TaxID=39947 RepID=B9EW97_ORYSJ|nr:hypothetical protein OsJ_01633 [Oryza sativa Japonica Group]BAS71974.1 Os01g0341100 [Oryza sativa Japonica Group]
MGEPPEQAGRVELVALHCRHHSASLAHTFFASGRCRSSSNRLVISYSRVADLAAASGKERKGGGALVDLTAASPGVIVAWVAAPPPNTVSTRRLGFLCPVPSPLGSLPFHPTQGF